MFVYLFVVVVVDVVFWLLPLRVVPVGRGSFTSGRPAVATATKHYGGTSGGAQHAVYLFRRGGPGHNF